MNAVSAEASAGAVPDWSALPPGVLQHVFTHASTWQAPGCCLGARVCPSWKTAAEGGRGIRLLYQMHARPGRDDIFAAWLARNSPQLDSLILSSPARIKTCMVLDHLATTATAAAAAGRPLRLRTLRVLGGSVDVELTGRLLAALPHLRTVQLAGNSFRLSHDGELEGQLQRHWAHLQQATQLEEVYLEWRGHQWGGAATAQLLPPSLQRMSWETPEVDRPRDADTLPDLTHLTRLTFLQLGKWNGTDLPDKLPPSLQQLQLNGVTMPKEELKELCGVVTSFVEPKPDAQSWPRVARLPKATAAVVAAEPLHDPATGAALSRLPDLCTLTAHAATYRDVQALISTAANLRGLRCLTIKLKNLPLPHGLGALTGLTRLTITHSELRGVPQQQDAWTHELAQLSRLFKWLSLPAELLAAGPWLGHLGQLQVLLLSSLLVPSREYDANVMAVLVCLLEVCHTGMLPPGLRLMGFTGVTVQDAAAVGLPGRLQRLLGGSGCEVVAGPSVEVLFDPTQQLAGLPEALQQALG